MLSTVRKGRIPDRIVSNSRDKNYPGAKFFVVAGEPSQGSSVTVLDDSNATRNLVVPSRLLFGRDGY